MLDFWVLLYSCTNYMYFSSRKLKSIEITIESVNNNKKILNTLMERFLRIFSIFNKNEKKIIEILTNKRYKEPCRRWRVSNKSYIEN